MKIQMKTALTIAGSDSSGGAGIQADLKTMTMHQVYGMSVITALTAQNTLGVRDILPVSNAHLEEQLLSIFEDIFPDAIKIGMIPNTSAMELICTYLEKYPHIPLVVDPVLIATSGAILGAENSTHILLTRLLPLATVVTPNLYELATLCNCKPITTKEGMVYYARLLSERIHTAVLVKGGHLTEAASDLLYTKEGQTFWYESYRIENPNTHGTGCTLSSAIASNLALGYDLTESIRHAKDYITGAIAAQLDLGHGNGPLNHSYLLTP